jgi:hypothetical protein
VVIKEGVMKLRVKIKAHNFKLTDEQKLAVQKLGGKNYVFVKKGNVFCFETSASLDEVKKTFGADLLEVYKEGRFGEEELLYTTLLEVNGA